MRGSIVRRGKSWATVVFLGKDEATGKKRQKWTSHKSKKDAEAHLNEVLTSVQGGTYVPPSKVRLGEFLERWLADYARGSVGPVTLRGYCNIVRGHLLPGLGMHTLTALSPGDVQGYFARKLRDGLSTTSVHSHYRVLRLALGHATRWGLVARNVALLTDPPRPRRYEARPGDREEIALFLGAARRVSAHYELYLTALHVGLRASELSGLGWADVDLAEEVAYIRQTFHRLAGSKRDGESARAIFKEPKSEASRRTVPLPASVVEALRALRRRQEEARAVLGADYAADLDLVFCGPTGKPLRMNNLVRRDFLPTIKAAGVKRIRFHDMRHSMLSHLAQVGVPIKVAQTIAGHASPTITQRIYTHVLAGQERAAVRALEAHFLGRAEGPD